MPTRRRPPACRHSRGSAAVTPATLSRIVLFTVSMMETPPQPSPSRHAPAPQPTAASAHANTQRWCPAPEGRPATSARRTSRASRASRSVSCAQPPDRHGRSCQNVSVRERAWSYPAGAVRQISSWPIPRPASPGSPPRTRRMPPNAPPLRETALRRWRLSAFRLATAPVMCAPKRKSSERIRRGRHQ
jgi:hypothetical protein